MLLALLLVLLLTSCADPAANPQAALNRYAEIAERGGELSEVLTQSALIQARASSELLQSLGYTQRGRAKFEIWSASNSLISGCLDLSDLEIIDRQGAFLSVGQRRSAFIASITPDNHISQFEVSQERC
jgi:ABC-type enterochelin transport system ATPase subunit